MLIKRFRKEAPSLMALFAMEGAMLQFTGSINGFSNNLFASNLGATDAQIGLIQTIPNLFAVLLMLPVGMAAQRARSSRTAPLCALLAMVFGYLLIGLVPLMGAGGMPVFYAAIALTVGGPALYNAQWQNLFGDVIASEEQNAVLTLRNRLMFIVGIVAPILCGVTMSAQTDTGRKLMIQQIFYWLCAAVAFAQASVVSRIPARLREPGKGPERDRLGAAVRALRGSRSFALFFVPVVIFYITWQFDWSMWYIGETQYLHMNEAELSIYNGVFNLGQLVAVGVLSGIVRRRSPDYALTFAAVGLLMCPLIITFCTLIPQGMRAATFTILVAVLNSPQCAIGLCVVQILLRVAPKEHRMISVTLWTLTVTLTNCLMPYLGVKLYTCLGSDYRAFLLFNLINAALRVMTIAMLVWRYRLLRRSGELPEGREAA